MKFVCKTFAVSLLVIFMMTSCTTNYEISKALVIDVSSVAIVRQYDTHGGFHNDGITYIEYDCSNQSFEDVINKNDKWKKLPLSDNLEALVYGRNDGGLIVGPFLTDEEDGNTLFPFIKNGYYFFEDKEPKDENTQNGPGFLNRRAFNFVIAIYDIDSQKLYYSEFDS